MVLGSFGNSGRYLNKNWHETRWEARTHSVRIDEWSEIDRTRFDLDSVEFDSKRVARFYLSHARIWNEYAAKSGYDVRQLPTL